MAFCEEIIRLRERKVAVENVLFFFIINYIYTFLKKCVYFSAKGSRKRSEKNNSLFYFCFCDVFAAIGIAGTILRSENKKTVARPALPKGRGALLGAVSLDGGAEHAGTGGLGKGDEGARYVGRGKRRGGKRRGGEWRGVCGDWRPRQAAWGVSGVGYAEAGGLGKGMRKWAATARAARGARYVGRGRAA